MLRIGARYTSDHFVRATSRGLCCGGWRRAGGAGAGAQGGRWLLGLALAVALAGGAEYVPSTLKPPAVPREFRGLWVASVKNLDWPSRSGLSTTQQQTELVALLDQSVRLNLNAVMLQVRPACDALYASTLEPWSEYLTGQMGRAPAPYYDPLEFAVREAHRRGLELHAWINPYRARHHTALSPVTRDHISRTHRELTRAYGKSLWLDPGEREVQEHSLKVVLDVVRRYDIDGVHFDDYFYPYPEKDARGGVLPFPDGPSWQRYQASGGTLGRDDWRRENVNLFMMRVSQSIHAAKPWVKFGIAPFGIWRPGFPPQIKGLDAYGAIYADSRKWLREGWVDYLAPQLYWGEEKRETSFEALAQWWAGENVRHRHVWPGLDLTRVGASRPAEEIAQQIHQTRQLSGSDGNLLWGLKPLLENRRGLGDVLRRETYSEPALVPSSPWLDSVAPGIPKVTVTSGRSNPSSAEWRVEVTPTGGESIWRWLVQTRTNGKWAFELLPGTPAAATITLHGQPEAIAVSAVDRTGMASAPVIMQRAAPGTAPSNSPSTSTQSGPMPVPPNAVVPGAAAPKRAVPGTTPASPGSHSR